MKSTAFIWQDPRFPELSVDAAHLTPYLVEAHSAEGFLAGAWSALPYAVRQRLIFDASITETIGSAAIRSTLPSAPELGDDQQGSAHASRIVAIRAAIKEAIVGCQLPVTHERLGLWHAASTSGDGTGYRDAESRNTWVVRLSRSPDARPAFIAPPSDEVRPKTDALLAWFNGSKTGDWLVHAALLVLWMLCIMPFRDRNWQIVAIWLRLILCRHLGAIGEALPLVSLIQSRKDQLFCQLRYAQRCTLDHSHWVWVSWFLRQYRDACRLMSHTLAHPIKEVRFWSEHSSVELKGPQLIIIRYLLDQERHGHPSRIDRATCLQVIGDMSSATASRHLSALVDLGILERAGLASDTSYSLAFESKTKLEGQHSQCDD